jgi:dTMP kinase
MANGKLIVIEGTDGSGKATQTKHLVGRLRAEGRQVATFSFPQYKKKSAGLVEEYLSGKYGPPDSVSPYAASLFYAVDRFDIAGEIRAALDRGEDVVLDRYVDSNAGHQGGKIRDPGERAVFLEWLYQIEYEILGIPRPNLVIMLYMPLEISRKLVDQRGGVKDGHEANLDHLKNAEDSYLWLVGEHSEDHVMVECAPGGEVLPPESIAEDVYQLVKPLLKE